MRIDIFGDLQEWDRVLRQLEELREVGSLDEHQHGLARLIRQRDNWRLREAALESALEVQVASDVLVADTLNSLVDTQTPLRLRIKAAQALGHLGPRVPDNGSIYDMGRVRETMEQLIARPQPPILTEAVVQALDSGWGK